MYFFIFLILFILIIPNHFEKKYSFIIYSKLFVCFIIYYYLNMNDNNFTYCLLTIFNFIVLTELIYRKVKIELTNKEEDNTIYNLAHEVKNPLAVCKGYLDMIDTNDKKKMEKYLPIIKNEMQRSLIIMDEFLSLKRIKIEKDLMDFSVLLSDIKSTLEVIEENKVKLNIPKLEEEIIIDGDYDKLKQVLINLIKNSYEADAKNISIELKTNSNYLKVRIIDDGKGISKDDLNKIGNLFYTTKTYGTGVGVTMAKEVIKLHDGSLSYDSIINKKTVVTIILPIKYVF